MSCKDLPGIAAGAIVLALGALAAVGILLGVLAVAERRHRAVRIYARLLERENDTAVDMLAADARNLPTARADEGR